MSSFLVALVLAACGSPEAPKSEPTMPTAEAPAPPAPPAEAGGAVVGQPAPLFTGTDTEGVAFDLAAQKGKVVVLEWFNPDCPFVKQAHGPGGSLVDLPKAWTDKGVVWVAVNSGAPGKEGAGRERNAAARSEYGLGYPVIVDESGDIGRAYGAKVTPHLFVIDANGVVAYAGGLDNAPFGEVEGGGAKQAWTNDALVAITSGQAPTLATTKPWGCSVKY